MDDGGGPWSTVSYRKPAPPAEAPQPPVAGTIVEDIRELRQSILYYNARWQGPPMRTSYVVVATDGSDRKEDGGFGSVSDDGRLERSEQDNQAIIGYISSIDGSTRFEMLGVIDMLKKAKDIEEWRKFGLVILLDSARVINGLLYLGGNRDKNVCKYGAPVANSFRRELSELRDLAGNFNLGVWLTHIPRGVVKLHIKADNYSREQKSSYKHFGKGLRVTVFIKPEGFNWQQLPPFRHVPTYSGIKKPVEYFLYTQLGQEYLDYSEYFDCHARYRPLSKQG